LRIFSQWGERGARLQIFLIPYKVGEKLFPYGKELPKKSGETPSILRLTRHSDPMKTMLRSYALPLILTLLALGAWAAVIWVALQVSTIVLNTLHQIVELAQLG
jgi:hypothetical protein